MERHSGTVIWNDVPERNWNGTKNNWWNDSGTERNGKILKVERNEKNAWNDFPERNGKIEYRSNGLLIA